MTAFDPDRDDRDQDLAWLAFGYAAGDLDPETALAFEQRLDADQAAREALAEAVLLTNSVATGARAERRRARRRTAVLALAACLAFAAAPRLFAPTRVDRPDLASAPAPAANPEEVALAWSGLRHEGEAGNAPDAGADALIDALAEPPAEPPPWLLEAAALPPAEDGQGS